MKKRRISLIILLLLLSAVCLLSIAMVWKEYAHRERDRHAFEDLASMVTLPDGTTVPTVESTEVPERPALDTDSTEAKETTAGTEPEPVTQKRNLAPIMEQNGDCVGWLYIEGTAVDYPVMHTPNQPQKYLRRNFHGEYSVSGVPFLDHRCSLDSTDLIIYGHNMRNGTMFADLKKYLDDAFLEGHRTIELETAEGLRYFTVIEVVKTDIYDERYDRLDMADGIQHLILSTCYGSSKSGRLLVIAVETAPN